MSKIRKDEIQNSKGNTRIWIKGKISNSLTSLMTQFFCLFYNLQMGESSKY